MPDNTPTPTEQPTPSAPVPTPPPAPAAAVPAAAQPNLDEPLGEAGKAALVKEREARAAAEKRAADAEKKSQEYEDRDKSEAQKRDEENTRLKAENASLALDNLRRDVATEKGLTPAQGKRLVGTTRDELEADADSIIQDFPVTPAKAPFTTDVGQGHRVAGDARVYRQSEIEDHKFYLEHKDDITKAVNEGRIVPD
ncbi:MAG: hypothetical protein ABIP33_06435 [Pseudolysinimonas sp.]